MFRPVGRNGLSWVYQIVTQIKYTFILIIKYLIILACDLETHFKCGTQCLPKTKICDGIPDCWNGHDELNCTREYIFDEFMNYINYYSYTNESIIIENNIV